MIKKSYVYKNILVSTSEVTKIAILNLKKKSSFLNQSNGWISLTNDKDLNISTNQMSLRLLKYAKIIFLNQSNDGTKNTLPKSSRFNQSNDGTRHF